MAGTFAEGHANVTVTETWRWVTIGGEKSMDFMMGMYRYEYELC